MPLRTVIFDFDLTLAVGHVFKFLAVETQTTTESGQLAQIAELDQSEKFRGRGGFASVMMGGPSRIAQLNELLSSLRASGVECLVCTRGLVGPVRKILHQTRLLSYFAGVYGNTGDAYGAASEHDLRPDPGPDVCFLGGPECQVAISKQDFVQSYMQQRRLNFNDVLFIDDTMSEVKSLQETCQTLHITDKEGMSPQAFMEVRRRAREGDRQLHDCAPQMRYPSKAIPAIPLGHAKTLSSSSAPFAFGVSPQSPPQQEECAEVWSNSSGAWCQAIITGCDEPLIHVEFTAADGQRFQKSLPRGHKDLKLLPGSPSMGLKDLQLLRNPSAERKSFLHPIAGPPAQALPTAKDWQRGGNIHVVEADADEGLSICHLGSQAKRIEQGGKRNQAPSVCSIQ